MKNIPNKPIKRVERRGRARLALFLALTMLLSLTLGACRRGEGGSSAATPEPSAEPTPDATAAPAHGGRLRMAMPENLDVGNESYDPLIVNTEEALNLYSLVFEPLIAVDEQNSLVPCLAINWSAAAHIENAWVVKLRDGVRWHSGAAFTADDVVFTWQRLCSLGAESYYRGSLASIESITKLDRTTVLVTCVSPGMLNLYALNFPILNHNFEIFDGTGPYRVTSRADERISMSVNSDWWDRPPYIETIDFYSRDSNETALASYSAGQLDLVPTALLAAGKYGDAGVTVVRDYMTQGMETILFNHRRSLMMNTDFRRAIAHSINRARIVSNVYTNRARSCDVPVPPDSWLYNGNNQQIDYNPHTAARLFEAAGCRLGSDGLLYYGASPVELDLLVSSSQDNSIRSDAASAIVSQLQQVGVTVNVITAAHGYGQQESEFLTSLRQMNWDMALVGFNLGIANDLSPYLSDNGSNNFGCYPGNVFSELLRQARNAPDEESLRAVFFELQTKFIEELPFIVLYFRLNSLVARSSLSGVSALREPALLRNIKNWYLVTD